MPKKIRTSDIRNAFNKAGNSIKKGGEIAINSIKKGGNIAVSEVQSLFNKKRRINNNGNSSNNFSNYEKLDRIDIPGYDIQYYNQPLSAEFCLEKCNQNNNCGGIALNTNNRECWLKNRTMSRGRRNGNNNRITYIKLGNNNNNNNNSNTFNINKNGVNYKVTTNTDSNGDDLTGLSGSPDDC